jgi:protein-disulfide isomerase/uncharacterized membrane protein
MRRITDRLSTYRPMLDRAVFGLAMLGLLTSAHIGIQQQRGFDQGCTGFSSSLFAGSSFDCGAVTSSEASTLLGLSNSVWGLLFYLAVAALTAAAAVNWKTRGADFRAARAVLVGAGFIYSLYLVYYQFFVLEELCLLCLLSAGIVTTLLLIHLVDINRSAATRTGQSGNMTVKPSRELTYMGAFVVLLGLLIGADALYFNSLEAPDVFASESTQTPMDAAASSSVERTATETQPASLPAECTYDLEKGRVEDHASLVNFFDPTVGDPAADVTVVEYFDPNCSHCKTFHDVITPVVRSHADQARFVFKPFVLWRHSVAQSEALYAAAQEGKFFEMLEAQYAAQNPETGLGPDQLRAIAEEIGMNATTLMQRLESGIYQTTLAQEKQKAVDIGVNSTPTVLINGRFLAPEARTVECLRRMIEEAAQG